jgi:ABC-type polar amino acid transport system ATPase subunit/GNAT superfamily N-acetyltransferase
MPTFNIIRESKPSKTFRVASIIGKFDLPSEHIVEQFTGNIDFDDEWQVGLIIGKSGTGKTTIAKELFPDAYITNFEYKQSSILDDMPKNKSVEEITSAFNAVGFSSPPSWLKPYSALSNGQKMRVDLANAILSDQEMFVFDEFTSVVDRNVAQIGSFAMQKAIRKTDKKFIAVTCHFDVEDWLLPNWVFDTDTMTFRKCEGQKKNRPDIKFEIFSTADKSIWKMFAKYHYLSHTHHDAASVYVALINNQIAGFLSVLHFPNKVHKNFKKVHRLVILPDYQGAGFGVKFLTEIAKKYREDKYIFGITTSTPSLIYSLKKKLEWVCIHFGKVTPHKGLSQLKKTASTNRLVASFMIKTKE